jgi:pimeloyl-ACP methyl ester carboxylesterase
MAQHDGRAPNVTSQSSEAPAEDDPRWQHHFAEVNGVRLHYVEAGAGPLVLLLHGFPEFWYGWRRQILALAAAGFRVVAPDLRGYNLSDKPRGAAAYALRTLVSDVQGLISRLGCSEASLIGHDWGAAIAWAFAMRHPSAVTRVGILNGPHPLSMLLALPRPSQLLKSWYMFFFQLPWLPERVARRDDYALLLEPYERLPPGARFTPAEKLAYRQAFGQPGALRSMIDYYRALLRPHGAVPLAAVEAEVLVLWGEQDAYLGRALARPSPRWAPRARVEYFPGVGHFIQHEVPEQVNTRLIRFLNGSRASDIAPALR